MASSGQVNTSDYEGRYLQLSWSIKNSLQDRILTNKTIISWTLKGAGEASSGYYETGNISVWIGSTKVYTRDKWDRFKLYNGTVVASGEHTITHDSDGEMSLSIAVSAGIYLVDVNCRANVYVTLDTIPRSSTFTASTGVLGITGFLYVTPALSSFKHRLTYNCGEMAGYIAGSTTTYTTATEIEWAPPLNLATQNTKGTSLTCDLTLYTYTSDGTYVGSITETISILIPSSIKPTCSIKLDSDPTGVMSLYGQPVQGLSKLKLTVTGTPSYESPIVSYVLNANGSQYTDATVTTDALLVAGEHKITATVKDQRGRSGSNSLTVDILPYAAPAVSKLSVRRCNEDGTPNNQGEYCMLTFSAVVSDLVGKNTPVYTLRYKRSTEIDYTDVTLEDMANAYVVTDKVLIIAADSNASYDVEIAVKDNHGNSSRATSLSTAFTLMNWSASGTGMGIGKVSEKDYALEVGIDADFFGDVYGKAYGLGGLPAIPEYADLNDYLTPGVFAIRTTEIAQTIKNLPVQLAGRLIVSSALGQTVTGESEYRYIEQKFIPYSYGIGELDRPAALRYIVQEGLESLTYRYWFNEALKAYPVGSIHIRYDHEHPGNLFGGYWERISSYLLRGATDGGEIGELVTLASGSGRTAINVSIWRRTA